LLFLLGGIGSCSACDFAYCFTFIHNVVSQSACHLSVTCYTRALCSTDLDNHLASTLVWSEDR